ncbi:hypothetical protein [Streptomyces sp. NBC_01190]|uniref:hypothetical protein n=1 Tax=Streptomyces sp. NBC_01190 TaxID=2903767 RepID=UPI0038703DA5|nr:hypothetical protein OG519_19355 [Streptomyces sp. NBC_01190]
MRRIRTGRARACAAAIAVAVTVPAVIAGTAGPAAADAGSLKVTTLDREGTAVASWMTVTSLDPATPPDPSQSYYRTGTALTFSPGRYAVTVRISEDGDTGQTLAAQTVTIGDGAPSALTFDARQGKRLAIGLDTAPGAGYVQESTATVCVGTVQGLAADSTFTDGSFGTRAPVYTIPSADPQIKLGYISMWEAAAQPDIYTVRGVTGLDGAAVTVPRAALGSVTVKATVGPSSYNGDTSAVDVAQQGTACGESASARPAFAKLPLQRNYHLTAGSWNFGFDTWHSARTVAAGSSGTLTFGRAVWGPSRYLPWVRKGELGFYTSGLIADPAATGSDMTINATATLYRDGKAVVTKTGLGNSQSAKGPKTFWAPITTSAAYTLKVHGYRHATGMPQPAGMMSTATDVAFSFHAAPASDAVPPAFLTRFLPNGLDLSNRLPAGHAVSIPLTLDRTSTQAGVPMWPSSAKTVEVFGSTDGGRGWHQLTVTRPGGAWAATLPAQPAGAEVSLSARITATGGAQTVTTVYRAFTTA